MDYRTRQDAGRSSNRFAKSPAGDKHTNTDTNTDSYVVAGPSAYTDARSGSNGVCTTPRSDNLYHIVELNT